MSGGTPTAGKAVGTGVSADRVERTKAGVRSGNVAAASGGQTTCEADALSLPVTKDEIAKMRSEFRAHAQAIETMNQTRLSSDNRIRLSEGLAGMKMLMERLVKKCLQMQSERDIVAKMSGSMIEAVRVMLGEDAKRRARESRRNLEDTAKLVEQRIADHLNERLGKDVAKGVSTATAGAVTASLTLYSEKVKSTLDGVTTRMVETAEAADNKYLERADALRQEVSQLREVVASTPAGSPHRSGGCSGGWTLVEGRRVRMGEGK